MITVTEHTLTKLNIRHDTVLGAVQDVRAYIQQQGNRLVAAQELIKNVLGESVNIDKINTIAPHLRQFFSLFTAQAVIEQIVKNFGHSVNEDDVISKAYERADQVINLPANSWMHTIQSSDDCETVAVVKGVDVKVEVKSDGSIKKGGKQILAAELYKKHVINAEQPMTNQQFIAVLMKELNMTKPGATTYAYNMRKMFNSSK